MLYKPLAEELIRHRSHIGGVYSDRPFYLSFTTGVIIGQGAGNGPFQTGMDFSKTIKPGSGECYHYYILVGLRMDYSKPARSESCNWRGRPCFTQVFWSKTIQLQQTFPVSFRLRSSQFGLSSSPSGNKGKPGEVDSKNKSRPLKKLNLPSLRSLICAQLPH